jgi:protein-tyrosine phosphatase
MAKIKHLRRVPIHSIKNFRDLGGYRTADGTHQVRWHRLFRSGHLHRLRGKDIERFQALGIQTVVDFRSAAEKDKEPDRLPADSRMQRIELSMLDEGNSEMMKDLRRRFEENDIQGLDTAAVMAHTYRQFPLEFSA